MSTDRKPTVPEILASANEGLDDAILAALDQFDPMRCEWNMSTSSPSEPCGALAGLLLVFGCCGETTVICPRHRDAADEQMGVLLARGWVCNRCDSPVATWRFVEIGGAK